MSADNDAHIQPIDAAPLAGRSFGKTLTVFDLTLFTVSAIVLLDTLAATTNLTPRTLNRLFLAELGMPPGRYYQFLRLSRARDLAANTDLGQRDIALRCGFSDAAALGKAFTRHFGYSIGKTRK